MQRLYVLYDDRERPLPLGQGLGEGPAGVRRVGLRARRVRTRRTGSPRGLRDAPGRSSELVAVGDGGEVYRGDSAWIMFFYAMEEFREWSFRLAAPALRPLARKAFVLLSKNRVNVADWLGLTDREAAAVFGRVDGGRGRGIGFAKDSPDDRGPGAPRREPGAMTGPDRTLDGTGTGERGRRRRRRTTS